MLALLNATLILAALCLWFAWGAISTAERVSEQIGNAAEKIVPIRAEIAGMTEEIAAARADLAAHGAARATDTSALEARIAEVEAQLAELTAAVTALSANPEALIESAVISAFEGLVDSVAEMLSGLRGTPALE